MEAYGNALVATAFLYGMTAGELTKEERDFNDHGMEALIPIRAMKSEV